MSVTSDILPVRQVVAPQSVDELVALMGDCYRAGTPVYPSGGGTSLDYGLIPRQQGLGISLAGLNRVVDYPARDMTITVEAGITMAELNRLLAAERQQLPIDASESELATLGGVIATNTNGARRYGYGTVRDYVIGISAIDGRGMPFKAGGRVVKNVAGYDFCKLLTGSLGTLAVITQATLKVRPVAEQSAFVRLGVAGQSEAEQVVSALAQSSATPVAIELLAGALWSEALGAETTAYQILVGLDGTRIEVDWMLGQLADDFRAMGLAPATITDAKSVRAIWAKLTEFPADRAAALVVKASVLPSQTVGLVARLQELDPAVAIQAHAGNGIVIARFAHVAAEGAASWLVKKLQPLVRAAGGSLVALSTATPGELTRQAQWGHATPDSGLMLAVKRQFDPKGLLNPGRFVY